MNRNRTRSRGGRRGGVDADVAAIIAAFSTPPTAARAAIINTTVSMLKASGAWASLDVLQVYAAADQQASLINWKQPGTYNATPLLNPAFAVDRGLTGDGVASYVDVGFNPTTATAPKYAQDSATFLAWARSAITTNLVAGAAQNNSGTIPVCGFSLNAAPNILRLNNTRATNATGLIPLAATGLAGLGRGTSTDVKAFLNGAALGSAALASIGVPNGNFLMGRYIGAAGSPYNASQFAACVLGSDLSDTQHAALYAALNSYMQAVGAA